MLRLCGLTLCGTLLPLNSAFAQEEGRADVTIRAAVTVENNQGLDFGRIIPGTGNSRIRINPRNGNLTILGNAVAAGGTPDRALFSVRGSNNQRVRISLNQRRVTLTRDGGSETMRLNRFRLDGRRNRLLDNTGDLDFAVGGQLRVRRNQAAGVYRGTFNVTVDYF